MTGPARFTSRLRSSARIPLLQVTKSAVATVLAWFIAELVLPGTLPVFAAIAALLVVQPSVNQSVGRAVERSFGVIAGVIIAFGIGIVFGQHSFVVLAAIVLAIFVGWALRLTPGSANQIPISVMLVLTIGSTTPDYALARIIETLIGAAIGVIVNILVVPPVLLAPAQNAVTALGVEIAATFDRLADALRTAKTDAQLQEILITARLLRPIQAKAQEALTAADESLAFNPRQQRYRAKLDAEEALFTRMGPLVTRSLNMTRAVHDHYDATLPTEPTVEPIVDELERAAHDLRLLVHPVDDTRPEPETMTEGLPLLTAPLRILTPHAEHWVLIGSLMEDLRRVHEEIVGTE
ncbi:FUSC family protein [Leifsonia sp. Leaf264]|uniref:FUSC family protein n=1 Tax=Leifsonia sp. Leaf264 TaxID=1736314 RepID=UPI0006FC780B|nr:FUSC family protein [Leifsonia sp. Leaf264]KQO93808.1 hypothetical protein ASF30_21625 [Leifsonia sp. Leaf264]